MNILKVLTEKRKIGNLGEREAARYLKRNGYRIIKRNYTALGAEIDIIARKKDVLAFIEVKTRNIMSLGYKEARPASSVTPEKQRKIIKAANHFISNNQCDTRLRLDVIEVYTENVGKKTRVKEIRHLEGAFDKDTAFDRSYYYRQKKEGSVL